MQQAAAVFEAHLGIGRAVEWAYSQKITQPLLWVGLEDAARPETIAQLSALDAVPSNTWLVSYFPWQLLNHDPSSRPALEAATIATWPSLYATDSVVAESAAYGHNDFRDDPMLRDVRVLDGVGLRAALRADTPLAAVVSADSYALACGRGNKRI